MNNRAAPIHSVSPAKAVGELRANRVSALALHPHSQNQLQAAAKTRPVLNKRQRASLSLSVSSLPQLLRGLGFGRSAGGKVRSGNN
jgi:hypothetical protein